MQLKWYRKTEGRKENIAPCDESTKPEREGVRREELSAGSGKAKSQLELRTRLPGSPHPKYAMLLDCHHGVP